MAVVQLHDEHPADLMARAHELAQEADELMTLVREKREEASRLQARAEGIREGRHVTVKRKVEAPDSLQAAAALAIEDLEGYWSVDDLMELLEIRDKRRGVKLVLGLIDMGLALRVEDKYRTVDPEESRVRDTLKRLGTCSREELADELELAPVTVDYYVELGAERGWCSVAELDGHLMYLKPGPERIITSRPRRRPPEQEPPAGLDAPRRGEPVFTQNHGERGRKMNQPGMGHKLRQRDRRREEQEAAKEARAAQQRAKAGADPYAARRAKTAAKRRRRNQS